MARCRNWCFTLNNPMDDDIDFWEAVSNNGMGGNIIYAILQEEVSETGTVHLQGYVEMSKAYHMSRMKTLFGLRYHFERRRGTQAQAIAYCKKEESRTNGYSMEYGTPKRTVKGGHFREAVRELKDGKAIEWIADNFSAQFAMWKDKLEDYALGLRGGRDWAMDIQIYVGASGTGKSYTALNDSTTEGAIYVAPWPTGGRWWWPEYRGEYTVTMDEFRHQIKMDVMLKLMDRYAWRLEAKGRNFQFCSKRIIITTNIDPKDWYPNLSKEKKQPLARRIREFAQIWDFDEDNKYPHFSRTVRNTRFEFNNRVDHEMNFGGGYGQY